MSVEMQMTPQVRRARARLAGLARRNAEPERIEAARGELRWANVISDVAKWPPLTDDQRAELTRIIWATAGLVAP